MSFRVRCLAGLIGLLLGNTAQAEPWKRYTNERFGTSVEVPAEFAAKPPPANNDGRTFVSRDGSARILVCGSNAPSVVVESFAAYRDWVADEEIKEGLHISYRARPLRAGLSPSAQDRPHALLLPGQGHDQARSPEAAALARARGPASAPSSPGTGRHP